MFRAGWSQPKAVPLSLVTRLEEIKGKTIELLNGGHMVQYRGDLMPLLRTGDAVRIREEGGNPMLVFSDGGRSVGLVVDEIVDIVEDRLDIEDGGDRQGMMGTAIVRGRATEIVDVAIFCRWPSRTGSAARTIRRAGPRAACCSSTIRRSSATC